jgi:hypothetical protein
MYEYVKGLKQRKLNLDRGPGRVDYPPGICEFYRILRVEHKEGPRTGSIEMEFAILNVETE